MGCGSSRSCKPTLACNTTATLQAMRNTVQLLENQAAVMSARHEVDVSVIAYTANYIRLFTGIRDEHQNLPSPFMDKMHEYIDRIITVHETFRALAMVWPVSPYPKFTQLWFHDPLPPRQ